MNLPTLVENVKTNSKGGSSNEHNDKYRIQDKR